MYISKLVELTNFIIKGVYVDISGRVSKLLSSFFNFKRILYRKKIAKEYGKVNKNFRKDAYIDLDDSIKNSVDVIFEEYLELKQKNIKNASNSGSAYTGIFPGSAFDYDSAVFKVALDVKVLSLIAGYLGEAPILHGLRILESNVLSKNMQTAEWNRDQLWHRDKFDTKSVRLFIYLTDVDEHSGPFQFFTKNISKKLFKTYYSRLKDSELEERGIKNLNITKLGPSGTSFLVDVRQCVHCGSKCLKRGRVAYTAIYTSSNPWQKSTNINQLTKEKLSMIYQHPLQLSAINK